MDDDILSLCSTGTLRRRLLVRHLWRDFPDDLQRCLLALLYEFDFIRDLPFEVTRRVSSDDRWLRDPLSDMLVPSLYVSRQVTGAPLLPDGKCRRGLLDSWESTIDRA